MLLKSRDVPESIILHCHSTTTILFYHHYFLFFFYHVNFELKCVCECDSPLWRGFSSRRYTWLRILDEAAPPAPGTPRCPTRTPAAPGSASKTPETGSLQTGNRIVSFSRTTDDSKLSIYSVTDAQLTPDWHENCKHQGSKVIKYAQFLKKTRNRKLLNQKHYRQTLYFLVDFSFCQTHLWCFTRAVQPPVLALLVTLRTHHYFPSNLWVTHLFAAPLKHTTGQTVGSTCRRRTENNTLIH